jgi:hypothetical protein
MALTSRASSAATRRTRLVSPSMSTSRTISCPRTSSFDFVGRDLATGRRVVKGPCLHRHVLNTSYLTVYIAENDRVRRWRPPELSGSTAE